MADSIGNSGVQQDRHRHSVHVCFAGFETGMPLRPEYIAEQIAKKKRPDPGIKAKVDTGLKSPTELKFVNQASYECGVLMTCVAAFPDLYTLIITDPSKPQPNDFFHVTVFGINRVRMRCVVCMLFLHSHVH